MDWVHMRVSLVDLFQAGGGATLALNWSGPGLAMQAVPATAFSNRP